MPIPLTVIGRQLPTVVADIDRGRLEFFAEAIGDTDPVYVDVQAARAAGHPDLPAPPTFLFGLRLQGADPFGWLKELDIDLRDLLHGSQSFDYQRVLHAGETVTLTPMITQVYAKNAGALEFIVTATDVTDSDGHIVARLEETLIVRHPTDREPL